ncbi:MAG: LysM peptidoglycan-binding domain-containing protein [Bacteroidia bacterium]
MVQKPGFKSRQHRACRCLLILLFCIGCYGTHAQEIKKSARIEKTGDKKYYIHTVEQGQTLYGIARAYALEVNEIIVENPEAIDGIKPGQELKIPYLKSLRNSYENTKPLTHKTEAGQTLYSISKQYGVTVEAIQRLNPELKDGLKAGQVIKIPTGTKEPDVKTPETVKTTVQPEVKQNTVSSKPDVKPEATEQPRVTDPASKTDTSYALIRKDRYRVSLFAPFHTENIENLDVDRVIRDLASVPPKTEQAVQFYQGFRLAMDSVKKTGVNIILTVYDVDDADSLRLQQIILKPELAESDLIVGPLSLSCFLPVARFAKIHSIPIVSPISQVNRVLLNNAYASKMVPSITTQMEEEAEFIVKTYKGQNVILINTSKEGQKKGQYAEAFKNRFTELQATAQSVPVFHEIKGVEGLKDALQTGKANIIVMPFNEQAPVTDMLRMLNSLSDKDSIIVFGMQSWSNFANLDYDYLNNLSLHYMANSFVDYESESTISMIKNYRLAFGSEPTTIAFQGYDAGYYYLKALEGYGTNFYKKLPIIKWSGTQCSFDLYKTSPESGFENKAVNIVMIRDFKLVRASK